jgi:hypothetical protein
MCPETIMCPHTSIYVSSYYNIRTVSVNVKSRQRSTFVRFLEGLREREELLHKCLQRVAHILDAFKSACVPTEEDIGHCSV